MVLITIVTGAYKPTYNCGASHCGFICSFLNEEFGTFFFSAEFEMESRPQVIPGIPGSFRPPHAAWLNAVYISKNNNVDNIFHLEMVFNTIYIHIHPIKMMIKNGDDWGMVYDCVFHIRTLFV